MKYKEDPRLSDPDNDMLEFLWDEQEKLLAEWSATPKWRWIRRMTLEEKRLTAARVYLEVKHESQQRAIFERLS